MTSYAFWNNKGGVGKSFLCFIAACEYAHKYSDTDVYVLDLCPQANVSETLLGGFPSGSKAMDALLKGEPRRSIAGYLDARLNSPFRRLDDVSDYVAKPHKFNSAIPKNLSLICGDNLLEVQSEAIRQTSQLAVPSDAWNRVLTWIHDLTVSLSRLNDDRPSVFIIDCNPSFAIFTQLALVAADHVVVPFTADDSSRRAVENVVTLLYGFTESPTAAAYTKISFAKKAKEEGVKVPTLHTFVSNRVTKYEGQPSKAFEAMIKAMKKTIDGIHSKHRDVFSNKNEKPSNSFLFVPDYHSASIVSASTGTPLHKLTAGPKNLGGERVQINPIPLKDYCAKLNEVVDRL
ncbi:ParA family protein [Candidatus Sumerlaeota bacterium]|nr:ParA family protein [Candidatus Sumerlaeota bacterium]